MKKLCLFTLVVLLVSVTSSFAAVPTATGQQILIPYAVVGEGWWTGVAIHNTSAEAMTFTIGVYEDDGTWVNGDTFTVNSHAMKVDLLENFLPGDTPPSLRMSVVIRCAADLAPTFQATLFLGNAEGGFGFQNYTSWDWVHLIFVGPIIIDPTLPIIIPRFPTLP